jgi:hypothetical protein
MGTAGSGVGVTVAGGRVGAGGAGEVAVGRAVGAAVGCAVWVGTCPAGVSVTASFPAGDWGRLQAESSRTSPIITLEMSFFIDSTLLLTAVSQPFDLFLQPQNEDGVVFQLRNSYNEGCQWFFFII